MYKLGLELSHQLISVGEQKQGLLLVLKNLFFYKIPSVSFEVVSSGQVWSMMMVQYHHHMRSHVILFDLSSFQFQICAFYNLLEEPWNNQAARLERIHRIGLSRLSRRFKEIILFLFEKVVTNIWTRKSEDTKRPKITHAVHGRSVNIDLQTPLLYWIASQLYVYL